MASQWYYLTDDNEQRGPVSTEELKKLAASGKLAPTDMVWKEGMADWVDASNLKGLFPGSKPPPAPARPVEKKAAASSSAGAQKPASTPAQKETASQSPAPAPARSPAPAPRRAAPVQPGDLVPLSADEQMQPLPMDDPFGSAAAMSAGLQPLTPMSPGPGYGQGPAMPMGQPQMQPTMPQSMGNPYTTSMARPLKPYRPKVKTQVWAIFLMMGAGLMILSFVSPWWGARFYHPTKEEQQAILEKNKKEMEKAAEEMREKMEENRDLSEEERKALLDKAEKEMEEAKEKRDRERKFYRKYDIGEYDDDFDGSDIEEGESKIWLVWGWQTGSGLLALIFGLLLVPLAIVFGFVKSLQPWSWIAFFISITAGVPMIVVFPEWFFGTPDENMLPVLRQGIIAGPWMALVSGVVVVVIGLAGGFMGLIAFVKR